MKNWTIFKGDFWNDENYMLILQRSSSPPVNGKNKT